MNIDPSKLIYQGIINSFKVAPTLWILILTLVLLPIIISLIKIIRFSKADIFAIDKMSGEEFESFLGNLFRKEGYIVTHTGSSSKFQGDLGADLVIEKEDIKTAVQAKRWKGVVTEKSVQEVVAAKAVYGCANAMVVTNSHFSKHALNLANANGVVLWDRNKLTSEILKIRKQDNR